MIPAAQVVEIRRLFFAEHWRVGTIATQAAPAVFAPRGACTSRAPRGASTTAITSGPTGPGVAPA